MFTSDERLVNLAAARTLSLPGCSGRQRMETSMVTTTSHFFADLPHRRCACTTNHQARRAFPPQWRRTIVCGRELYTAKSTDPTVTTDPDEWASCPTGWTRQAGLGFIASTPLMALYWLRGLTTAEEILAPAGVRAFEVEVSIRRAIERSTDPERMELTASWSQFSFATEPVWMTLLVDAFTRIKRIRFSTEPGRSYDVELADLGRTVVVPLPTSLVESVDPLSHLETHRAD